MNGRRRQRAYAFASRLALVLLAIVIALVFLNAPMISGAANCASDAPDFRCAVARFIAG
jgi:hypothetical protein